ncbi:SAV_6107 family HEPN domain-containing protein [Streptomyces sp. ISL-98]|uniref:SAV_6107 family HEPN domain-containing protein n=1 Tax=Streptomyces sp. ISL-98 TaxID=2819192 RepID=UPI0035B21093
MHLAPRARPIRRTPTVGAMPPAALDLIAQARVGLREAVALGTPNERYATAHLAALRTAAAVLAARGRPEEPEGRQARIRSAWEILPEVAPELAEWSALFAASARTRARAEAGVPGAASEREADDLVRDATMFVRLVERILPQLPAPDLFELTENQDTGAAVRQLSHGFDELFKALGPPPPGLRQLQPVPDGGGGTER